MIQPTFEFPGIKIWDDFIDDRFILDLDEESNNYSWSLDNVANRKSFPYKLKGSHLLWASNFFKLNEAPKKISNLYNFLINDIIQSPYILENIQLNGQFLGQNGTTHTDSKFNEGKMTLMVFITFKWQKEWGGEFQLLEEYKDNAKIIKSIEYIPGRIILFDGSIPHRGLAPTKPNIFRKSLVFRIKK